MNQTNQQKIREKTGMIDYSELTELYDDLVRMSPTFVLNKLKKGDKIEIPGDREHLIKQLGKIETTARKAKKLLKEGVN